MHHPKHSTVCGSVLAFTLLAATFSAQAEDVTRLGGGNPKSPIAQAITVPEGYKTDRKSVV